MRILNLVKYDFYSIFKSPLTYLAILVVSSFDCNSKYTYGKFDG